ncbi:MAG: hypothetical protein B6I24_11285 [Bacteroidetes bacterium 4572_128]|nr:MAG: hypothetical protein B6I24_11285 [Bacteroidetes bacterium 4572_128]
MMTYAQTEVQPEGAGTEENPFQIATLDNLHWLTQNFIYWGKHYIQTADIDAIETSAWDNGQGFLPIGNDNHRFSGVYDGQNHVISNLCFY